MNGFIKGMTAGMVAGAVLGIMVAPQNRKRKMMMKNNVGKAIKAIGELVDDVSTAWSR